MTTVAQPESNRHAASRSLQSRLAGVARRTRLIGTANALLWAIALTGMTLLLLAWLDIIWHFPESARRLIVPLAVVVGVCVGIVLVRRSWMQTSTQRIARRLDEVGGTGGQILTGWELLPENQCNAERDDKSASLSRGIASVAVDQASARASTVSTADAAPWRESQRSGVIAMLVVLVAALFAWIAPGAFGTSWSRIASPSNDTPPYSPLVFEVSPGDIQLTYGQPMEVTALITGGAIENASLVLGDPRDQASKRVAMFPRGGGRWQAVIPRVTESTTYCVTAGRGRSPIFHLEVLETPSIDKASFTIIAPEYTHLPPIHGQYPQDHVAGLAGTTVEFVIQANRPLQSGTVTIEASTSDQAGERDTANELTVLRVSPEQPQQVTGSLPIERAGTWEISVTGANGVDCESPIRLEVELLVDQPPEVRIAQPRARSYATPNTQIPVATVAEDDYGIARLRLYRIIDGSRPIPLELPVETAARRVQGGSTLPLDAFGLEPGDRITLLARVDDTRPHASQGGESQLAEIEIISQRDFNRILAARQGKQMLENKFRQAARLLEQLATEAAELEEQVKNSDKNNAAEQKQLQEKLDQLRQKMESVANELAKLADQELPLEMDQHWNDLLRKQADALRQAAKNALQMKNDGKANPKQASELKKAIDKLRQQQQEQIGQPMEALRKIAPLIAAESIFVQLVARQRAVVDALDRYRQDETIRDPADRQQIVALREEEAAIRRDLAELMNAIETSADALGDDPDFQELQQSSLDFVQAIRDSQIDPELTLARKTLGKFNGSKGYGHALTALEEMEKFLGQCKSNGQKAGSCLKKKFQPGLPKQGGENSLQQMLNQMGLNSGPKSGYSMRGNTGQNVGLYGNQPFAQPTGRGRGGQNQMMPSRGQGSSALGSDRSKRDEFEELPETSRSSSRDVPLRYRKQTEQYLQRLAEQLDP